MPRVHRLIVCLGLAWIASQTAGAQNGTGQLDALAYPLLQSSDEIERQAEAFERRLPYIPGEVLVKFRDGTPDRQLVRALSVGRGPIDVGAGLAVGDALLLSAPDEPNAEAFADVLRRQPEVEWAQPNYITWVKSAPNDPSYQRQWNMDLIGMPNAWDINRGGSPDVVVAVVDTGITVGGTSQSFPLWNGSRIASSVLPFAQNPDIGTGRFAPSRDFAFWAGPVLDMVGHGTHVAGTILQETNNNLGLAGIAYNTKLMPLKACIGYWELQIARSSAGISGSVNPSNTAGCSTSAVVSAVRFAADNGAKIINLSIGGDEPAPAILDALKYAVGRGAFVSIAAGNEFEDGNPTEYPAAYGPQVDGAMTVGAVGRSRRRAFYSNTGPAVEIAAPGGDQRDGGAAGLIYQTGLVPADIDSFTVSVPRFDRYQDVAKQGTSMAAPHVAGVAALLYAQGIRNPAAIEAAIKRFAVDLGTPGRDDEFGAGLVDARAALRGMGMAK